MNSRASDIRDVSLLSAACLVGAAMMPLAPILGMPLVGAGAAGLTYRGFWTLAAVAGLIGAVLVAIGAPYTLALTVPTVACAVGAALALRTAPFQAVALVLVVVLAAGMFGMAAVAAQMSGSNLVTEMNTAMDRAIGEIVKSLNAYGVTDTSQIEQLGQLLSRLWPADYIQTAAFMVALLIAAITWAARRSGKTLPIPPMARLDLNINVIWLPVAAFALLAAGAAFGGPNGVVFAVGLNVLLVARTLILFQGLGVAAWLMERAGIGAFGRGVGYVLLVILDIFFVPVTFVGLVDFWANFRKLPRDGQPAPQSKVGENES